MEERVSSPLMQWGKGTWNLVFPRILPLLICSLKKAVSHADAKAALIHELSWHLVSKFA